MKYYRQESDGVVFHRRNFHFIGIALMLFFIGVVSGCNRAADVDTPPEKSSEPAPDPMLPVSSPDDAIVAPLSIVTIATVDMEATRQFYEAGMGMDYSTYSIEGDTVARLSEHWQVPLSSPLTVGVFRKTSVPDAGIVRAVLIDDTSVESRPGYDSRPIGPLGFGYPGSNLDRRAAAVTTAGYTSSRGVVTMDFPRADGSTYTVGEIHFKAPDGVLVLGVDRDTLQPVGPIDPATEIGGVAYASVLVSDLDENAAFMNKVLGLERRREMSFQSGGPEGGMVGLRKGENVAFEQWFTPGARTGYLVVMTLLDGYEQAPAPYDLTSRGISMWSFETENIEEIASRWAAYLGQSREDLTIRTLAIPGIGSAAQPQTVQALMIETPDGIPVEVYQLIAQGEE